MFKQSKKKMAICRGFTLIELLITVAIIGLLSSLAAPSFIDTIQRYRVSTVANELVAAINLTRNFAIQNNGNVILEKLTGTSCTDSDSWTCGWQVYRDANADGNLDAGELIQKFVISQGVAVRRSQNGGKLTGNRWGQINGNGAVGFTLTPTGEGVSSPATTTVCLNSGGRVRITKGDVTC